MPVGRDIYHSSHSAVLLSNQLSAAYKAEDPKFNRGALFSSPLNSYLQPLLSEP